MDVFGTPDIGRQFGVTLCGASVAGRALQTFLLHSLSSHALSTGLHRLACAILQPEPDFGRGETRVFEDTLEDPRASLPLRP